MKLFLDTNVLLDHALNRRTGQPLEVAYIMLWTRDQNIPIYISPGSLYTFAYILQKNGIRGRELRLKIEHYLSLVQICQSDKQHFLNSIQSDFTDLEDAFQYFHGRHMECDHLITSNCRDFRCHSAGLKVMSPAEFISQVLHKTPGIDF